MNIRRLTLLASFIPLLAHAQGTKLWRQSTFQSFEAGTPEGVAIYSDGRLEPSPQPVEKLTAQAGSIWAAAADAHGNVYLGTGSPAQVLKVAPDGRFTPLLKTRDVSVQSVRIGPDGMVYAATLPGGKVYRLNPAGPLLDLSQAPARVYASDAKKQASTPQADVVFDPASVSPKPAYIWDLAFDKAGRLYVATGGPAAIYRVDLNHSGATPEKFFSSSEEHIRCLLFAPDGTLYAGTDGRGLIYRIDSAGKGFVLFEAPRQEIPALALDPAGNLYAAAIGGKTRTSLPPLTVHSAPTLTATIRIVTGATADNAGDSTVIPDGTLLYQIAPDGAPREIWSSPHDIVYALTWQPETPGSPAGLLTGSGNKGHLYRIEPDGTYADLAHLEALQTTALLQTPAGVYAATSNPAKLYQMPFGNGRQEPGTYTSQVHDAKFFSQWGRFETRGNGGWTLFARVGNIEQPGEGWSGWQTISSGEAPALAKGRYFQWKAQLKPGAILRSVGVYYLPQNVAPVVDAVVVRLHARVTQASNPTGQINPVPITLPGTDGNSSDGNPDNTPLMAVPERTWATARWTAHDPNGDRLRYSVYYRADDAPSWILLRRNIFQTWTSFDTARLPDGGYTLRVVASDAPSQPPGQALTAYRDSAHFLIDTATPVLSALQATQENGALHATFTAQTQFATIARAYYSLDGGPWQYIEPIGRLSDATQERYDFRVPLPHQNAQTPPGQTSTGHVLAVRVLDRGGNSATTQTVIP
jgi:hypothetical protein